MKLNIYLTSSSYKQTKNVCLKKIEWKASPQPALPRCPLLLYCYMPAILATCDNGHCTFNAGRSSSYSNYCNQISKFSNSTILTINCTFQKKIIIMMLKLYMCITF